MLELLNKILEAIQRGVQMGLEIQDDELDQTIFKGSQITSDYHTGRSDYLRWRLENFIDLGLPSGTLWCKWNLGATNGKTAKSWYGDYYAWGELKVKKIYDWETYKYQDESNGALTKYGMHSRKGVLDPEDDIVSVTLGEDFGMPTKEDFEELCQLQSEWIKDYNGIEGLNGRIFTGNNGKELFIPAAGYHFGSEFRNAGSSCNLWSSSLELDYHINAFNLYFNSKNINQFNDCGRQLGFSVRGVLKTR